MSAPGPQSRLPVLAGAGVAHQHEDDPAAAAEAIELMALACERAGEDAGRRELLAAVDAVLVPQGSWPYRDPGRLLAERFGASARTLVAQFGVLQQTLLARACAAIQRGDMDVVLVVGGEAKYRALRAAITGTTAHDATQPTEVVPDDVLTPRHEIIPERERVAGLRNAPLQYSLLETALRVARGETPAENARATARLWSAFSRVAAANPDAWRRDPVAPELLEHPSPANPMLAAPYTKLHCSQWNVDQAAAFLLCSGDAADRFGIADDRRVFPHALVESNDMVPVSERAHLHRAPAVTVGAGHIADRTGVDPADATFVDLYSCFPVAVRIQASELGIPAGRDLTVTGGMTFAGGPLNNYTFQALAAMVPRLRARPGSTGLVTCISGLVTKHAMALWSAAPPRAGCAIVDTSAETAAATERVDPVDDHRGPATLEAYTVAHEDGRPAFVAALARTADGRRAVVRSDDTDLAGDMTGEEWCARSVAVDCATFRA